VAIREKYISATDILIFVKNADNLSVVWTSMMNECEQLWFSTATMSHKEHIGNRNTN